MNIHRPCLISYGHSDEAFMMGGSGGEVVCSIRSPGPPVHLSLVLFSNAALLIAFG